jgi:hypothetical protein
LRLGVRFVAQTVSTEKRHVEDDLACHSCSWLQSNAQVRLHHAAGPVRGVADATLLGNAVNIAELVLYQSHPQCYTMLIRLPSMGVRPGWQAAILLSIGPDCLQTKSVTNLMHMCMLLHLRSVTRGTLALRGTLPTYYQATGWLM